MLTLLCKVMLLSVPDYGCAQDAQAVCCRPVTQIGWSQFHPIGSRQQSRYIVPKSCIYSQSAPEDGRNCRPKHVEQDYKNQ